MITFRQHIKVMNAISNGKTAMDYADTLKPLDKLKFLKDSVDTYPLTDNFKNPDTISLNSRVYSAVEELVLGQFIMLEQIITGKTKLPDHLVDLEIAKLIIRPTHHEVFDNENVDDEKSNEEIILNSDVREVYYALDRFIESRNKTLFTDFAGVFYEPPSGEDEEPEETESKTADMVFSQQWYWYSIVRTLANEDVTKYEQIYMLSMRTVLPEMSFLAQRNKIEQAEQRKSKAMRNL